MQEVRPDLFEQLPEKYKSAALYITSKLTEKGHSAYLVGGVVRDLLLGLKIKDIDFTTSAKPEEVIEIFERVIPVGI